MIDVIWKCLSEQDLQKDIELRTVRFIDSCWNDMSVHQINELVNKNLTMNYYNFAESLVQKISVKDLRFQSVFKEWASHLVITKFKHLAPWDILEKIMLSIDKKHSNATKAFHDYISMIITSKIDMTHFLKLSESFFNFCDVKAHLLVLSYIINNMEWEHFQHYVQKLDTSKI